jgi:hypothetical protein
MGKVFERRGLKKRKREIAAFILRGQSIEFTATDSDNLFRLR